MTGEHKKPVKRLPNHEVRRKQARTEAGRIAARKRKSDRLRKEVERLEKRIKDKETELERRERTIKEMELSPTPAQQRKILFAKFREHGFDPIDDMISYATDMKVPKKERISVVKELAGLAYAKPKSIDVQGELGSNVSIQVVDFGSVTQKALKQVHGEVVREALDVEEDEYAEFVSPEERRAEEAS